MNPLPSSVTRTGSQMIAAGPFGRGALASLIVIGTLALLIPRQVAMRDAQRDLARTRTRLAALQDRLTERRSVLDDARRQFREQSARRDRERQGLTEVQSVLASTDPESRWATPPGVLPEWNPESPYVWLRKEMLPQLPVRAFSDRGGLSKELATLLMLGDTARLDQDLEGILASYHRLESANAEFINEPLPGFDHAGSVTVRVRPFPEEGAALRQRFESAIQAELSEGRSDLLLQMGQGWLNSQFGSLEGETKTISVEREAHGAYSLAIRSGSGGGWMSVGGVQSLEQYVPRHLLPLFNSLNPKSGATAAP